MSHSFAAARHSVPTVLKPLAGQTELVPLQVAAVSHRSAAARHTVPAFPGLWSHAGAPTVPLHWSVVQTLPSSVQAVPAVFTISAGQLALLPVHVSARSHSFAAARHWYDDGLSWSAGQVLFTPSHDSGASHRSVAGRQTAVLFTSAGHVVVTPSHVSGRSQTPADARHTVVLPAAPPPWQV